MDFYQLSLKNVFAKLRSSKGGLSTREAGQRLTRYGYNELPQDRPPPKLFLALQQLKSPLIYILIFAALVTVYLREWADATIIMAAVVVNTIVGFVQEYKAQREILALRKMLVPRARVWRDGELIEIDARYLVPGDVIRLVAGDKVPADAQLLQSADLRLNEAVLTGESEPVVKRVVTLRKVKPLGERVNSVYWGTQVVQGTGTAVVVATGVQAEMGKIAAHLERLQEEETPLQKRLARFSQTLAIIVGAVCLLILVVGLAEGREFEAMFTTAVAVAVAAIPEGLVVSLTVILALGMRRIFQKKALVRKLVAAETLGSTTVICVDKTGTLTEGKMKVTQWEMADDTLAPQAMIFCNDLVNQTERALWEKVQSSGVWDPQKVFDSLPRLAVIPFSSQKKFMATLHPWRARGRGIIFAKGAPEVILGWCKMGVLEREKWEGKIREWGREGLRLIALASKEVGGIEANRKAPDLHPQIGRGFKFLGLVGLTDPLRPEVKHALSVCQRAGVRVVVLTGDYRQTAEAVMTEALGVKVKPEEVLEASVLEKLSPEELEERIGKIKLFARVTPTDKLRIVKALKARGEVVAMTGDGVNDALALKQADIGIVVGEATEVAKETADVVLLDSNFKTIVAAIEEGRSIFENMKKVIVYLLSDSFTEVILVGGSLLFRLPLPITAAQILWINLVEDGLPGMALAFEDREPGLMKDPPRNPREPLLDKEMKFLIFVIGVVTDLALFGIFLYLRSRGMALDTVRSFIFAALGFDSLLYVYACRSLRRNIWHYSLFHNIFLDVSVLVGLVALVAAFYIKPLAGLLKVVPLSPVHWAALFALAVVELLLVEAVKWRFTLPSGTPPKR